MFCYLTMPRFTCINRQKSPNPCIYRNKIVFLRFYFKLFALWKKFRPDSQRRAADSQRTPLCTSRHRRQLRFSFKPCFCRQSTRTVRAVQKDGIGHFLSYYPARHRHRSRARSRGRAPLRLRECTQTHQSYPAKRSTRLPRHTEPVVHRTLRPAKWALPIVFWTR